MNKFLKWVLIVAGILIVIAIAYQVAGSKKDTGEKVTVEEIEDRTVIETVSASGNLYPEVEVKISPDISGEITELTVQEGDSVRKGQLLARIYADIYALQRDEAASAVNQTMANVANNEASIKALEASLKQAEQTYQRNKTLFSQKIISAAEFEQFEANYESAKANFNAAKQSIVGLRANVQSAQTGLSRANKDLGRTTLIAPMDGIITSLIVKRGERVAGNSFNVGTEMMTVADMSVLEVRVNVNENDIIKVNIGDSADVEIDAYNTRKFKGIVTRIASSIKTSLSAATNEVTNYEVRIRLIQDSYTDLFDVANPRKLPFRPGMNANAEIKTKRKDNVLAVPIIAVNARLKENSKSTNPPTTEAGAELDPETYNKQTNALENDMEEVVFVLQADGTVKKRIVTTGIQDINYIEILSGLQKGEKVITGPYTAISNTLKDNSKVIVVSKDELFK